MKDSTLKPSIDTTTLFGDKHHQLKKTMLKQQLSAFINAASQLCRHRPHSQKAKSISASLETAYEALFTHFNHANRQQLLNGIVGSVTQLRDSWSANHETNGDNYLQRHYHTAANMLVYLIDNKQAPGSFSIVNDICTPVREHLKSQAGTSSTPYFITEATRLAPEPHDALIQALSHSKFKNPSLSPWLDAVSPSLDVLFEDAFVARNA